MSANRPYIIGLTGGIGTGKSEAAKFLASLGAVHLDADAISHELTEPGGEALEPIRAEFGEGVFHEDGTLDRQALAQITFSDPARKRALEAILHPRIQRDIMRGIDRAAEEGAKVVILDVPLLFETGMDALCDGDLGALRRYGDAGGARDDARPAWIANRSRPAFRTRCPPRKRKSWPRR